MKILFFILMFYLTPLDAHPQDALPTIGADAAFGDMPTLGGGLANAAVDENGEVLSFMELKRRNIQYSANVSSFDIAGLTIGMTPKEVSETAEANGFMLKSKREQTPPFLEWQYKRNCLDEHVNVHSSLKKCMNKAAEEARQRYVEKLLFEKKELKETLTVYFTGPFQGNHAYRIVYKNTGNHSWNSSDEGRYLKQKRSIDFWALVARKYGAADDETAMVWGNGEEGPTLQVKLTRAFLDAYITLEDLTLMDKDSENMEFGDTATLNKFSF